MHLFLSCRETDRANFVIILSDTGLLQKEGNGRWRNNMKKYQHIVAWAPFTDMV